MSARRAIGGGGPRRVTASGSSAACDEYAIANLRQVPNQNQFIVFSLLVDDRTGRDFERQVGSVSARAIGSLCMHATLTVEFGMEAVIDQRVLVEGRGQVDGAAMTAVTAAW